MKLNFRSALALLLGTALAGTLSSCDYSWSPGKNPQNVTTFTRPPGWRSFDVDLDSINNQQRVEPAGGVGSAAAIQNGTVQDQLNSAPAGKSAAASQAPDGTLGAAKKPTLGTGTQNDQPQPK